MADVSELKKLKTYLDDKGYKNRWSEVVSPNDQIIVYDEMTNERIWDVVCHQWSYGGDKGLLEVLGSICEDAVGFLTADDVINRLESGIWKLLK